MIKNELGRLEMHPLPPVTPAKVMFIGEYPNIEELRAGRYFISSGAEALRRTAVNSGIKLEDCYFTVAVPYLMSKKNKEVPADRWNKERNRLVQEAKDCGASIIVPLGAMAAGLIMNQKSLKITKIMGNILDVSDLPNVSIIPTYHPAALLYSPGLYKVFANIMDTIAASYKGKPLDPGVTEWKWIESREELIELMNHINTLPFIAADIEASGLVTFDSLLWVIGIAYAKNKVKVIDRAFYMENFDLIEELFLSQCSWTWHHGKFDTQMLHYQNHWCARLDDDTIYMSYALNETSGSHSLGQLATVHLGADEYKSKMNSEFAYIQTEADYEQHKQDLGERVATDADYTFQLRGVLWKKVEEYPELVHMYHELLIDGANFLRRVQMNGCKMDVPYLEARIPIYEKLLEDKTAEIVAAASLFWDTELYRAETKAKSGGQVFNPKSVKQLAWLVYDRLKLKPAFKKGAKKRKTDVETLTSIPNPPAFLQGILELRSINKEFSTYIMSYLKLKDKNDFIHTNFNLHVTVTGRLSSTEPNIQNVPAKKPDLRRAYIPRAKNRILMEVDYSGAELRVLAFASGDVALSKALTDGDPHGDVAVKIFGETYTKGESSLQKILRGRAKTVNFGIAYGRQAPSLAEDFGISIEEAQSYIDAWAAMYPQAWEYLQGCETAVRTGGELVTLYGRHRRMGLIHQSNVQDLINEAKNFRIQSISSDNTFLSGMDMEEELLNTYDTYIINLIHDSILLDLPADPTIVNAVAKFATGTMIAWPKKRFGCEVPFKSDVDLGPNWGDFGSYDIESNTVTYNKISYDYSEWIQSKGVTLH